MKQGLERPGRQKDGVRVLRQTQKLYSEISPASQLKKLPPKGQIKSEANGIAIESESQSTQSIVLNQQKGQYQMVGRNIRSPPAKWKKDSKLASFKSEQPKNKIRSAIHLPETKNIEKIISQGGQQYRKDLIENQERKAKISLHAAVAKKQLDFVERKKDGSALENNKLKLQLNLLQKQLLAVKENQQRLKRKYQVQIFQKNSQIQRNATLISELQQNLTILTAKTENMVKLQRQVSIFMSQKIKANQELQKITTNYSQLAEKNRAIQYNYKSLFQNYAKLEVSFQSLQRELHITKEYLSKTQALHCQTKEESYKMYQQKTKQLQQKSSIIASLKTELSSLHQKIEKMNINEQKRQKLIDQYKTIIQNQKSNQIACLFQKSKLQSEMTSITIQNNLLLEDKESSNQQIAKLKKACELHIQQLKEQEIYCQQIEQELKKSEMEWALTIKHQLNRISDQKLQYITKLEQQLQFIGEINKELRLNVSKKEEENQDLKQLLQKRQNRPSEQQVGTLRPEQVNKQMHIVNVNAELEHAKHQQKLNSITSVNQQKINRKLSQMKTQSQQFENAFLSQSSKNQQLAAQIAHKQAQNVRYLAIIQEIQMKIQKFGQQIQNLTTLSKQQQENPQKLNSLIHDKSGKSDSTQNSTLQKIEATLAKSKLRIVQLNETQKESIKKEKELRKFYKTKSYQLEKQVQNMSILLRNESAKSFAQRQKNVQSQQKIQLQQQHNQQMKQQTAVDYSEKLRNMTLDYQKQKHQLSKQVKRQKKQNAVLRKELQLINSWLLANNDKITAIMQQLSLLKKVTTNQNQTLTSTNRVEKHNGTIIQVDQQTIVEHQNVQLSRKGSINSSLDMINTEMVEMKRILNLLKQERQLFVKKYIQISNQVATKENALQIGSQIKIMEHHFTQLSVLHTKLNNALLRVQNKLVQISIDQKSLQMGVVQAQTI